jgi:hypothetical protein
MFGGVDSEKKGDRTGPNNDIYLLNIDHGMQIFPSFLFRI